MEATYIIHGPLLDKLKLTIGLIADILICLGGFFPFLPQYLKIQRVRSSKGFSPNVCIALLLSNIIRLFFWIVKHFRWPLLVQSFVNIIIMTEMLRICSALSRNLFRSISMVCLLCSVACLIFGKENEIFVETLGLVAVSTESVLGLPQVLLNYRRKSTQGLSATMIILWFLGDLLKVCYLTINKNPVQFVFAALTQCSMDIIILGQTAFYDKVAEKNIF
ncbi:hypothetical protein GJ496_009891 [Pomphorhynchus laevis]|nr:hypothetical protein GJ496_009891 [Pomphorhynchus laevis]